MCGPGRSPVGGLPELEPCTVLTCGDILLQSLLTEWRGLCYMAKLDGCYGWTVVAAIAATHAQVESDTGKFMEARQVDSCVTCVTCVCVAGYLDSFVV